MFVHFSADAGGQGTGVVVLGALDGGPQGGELADDVLVAPFDQMGVLDDGNAIGGQRRDDHGAQRQRDPAAARLAMRNHFQRLFESMLEATENEALAEIRRRTQQDRERFMAATGL